MTDPVIQFDDEYSYLDDDYVYEITCSVNEKDFEQKKQERINEFLGKKGMKLFLQMLSINTKTKNMWCYRNHHIYDPVTKHDTGKVVRCLYCSNSTLEQFMAYDETNPHVKWRRHNVWFTVNTGTLTSKNFTVKSPKGTFVKTIKKESRKEADIQAFNAFYFDFDLHDENKNHYQGEALTQKKSELYKTLKEKLPMKPSIIVESRNGFHVYFCIDFDERKSITLNTWKTIEKNMINYFQKNVSNTVDAVCKDASRILRVPYSYHQKADDITQFPVTIKYISNTCYKVEAINAIFPSIKSYEKKKHKLSGKLAMNSAMNRNEKIEAIKKFDAEYFKNYFSFEPRTMSYEAAQKTLKSEINLLYFLGIEKEENQSFNCIIHEDKHPSAVAFFSERENNYTWLYYNNATGETFDIVHLVKTLTQVEYNKALFWLAQIANISILSNEEQSIEALCKENLEMFDFIANDYKFLKKYRSLYETYLEISIEYMHRYEFTKNAKGKQMMCTYEYLTEKSDIGSRQIKIKMIVLILLGIIDKVTNKQKFKIGRAYKTEKFGKLISVYEINSLKDKCDEIMKNCKMFTLKRGKNGNAKGLTKEKIIELYDCQVAAKIFTHVTIDDVFL